MTSIKEHLSIVETSLKKQNDTWAIIQHTALQPWDGAFEGWQQICIRALLGEMRSAAQVVSDEISLMPKRLVVELPPPNQVLLGLRVTFDPSRAIPDKVRRVLQLLLDTATSTPGVLDELGDPLIEGVEIIHTARVIDAVLGNVDG